MNKGAEVNQEQAKRRAEGFYLLYASMGGERSLVKLHQTLSDLGLPVSLNTLKSYSSKYDWQARAALVALAELPAAMDERQAAVGRAIQALAEVRLQSLEPSDLTVTDVVRLMTVGVKIEREAMAVPMERHQLLLEVINPMIQDLVDMFRYINDIEDKQARVREWALRGDAIVERHIPQDMWKHFTPE